MSSKAFVPSAKLEQINAASGFAAPRGAVPNMAQHAPLAVGAVGCGGPEEDEEQIEYRVTGRLKFFNEAQSYGFILSDIDSKDIFFHFDDMKKTALSKQFLKEAKNKFIVRFQFKVMGYYGKYTNSKKAVDIELLKIEPILYQG